AEVGAAEADHDVPVSREMAARDATEAELTQARQQLVGGPRRRRRRIQRERELGRIARPTEESFQRAKHRAGPGTKSRASGDHSSVATSMSVGPMRMLFTDDGRPPRERFEIVPAVDMIVP